MFHYHHEQQPADTVQSQHVARRTKVDARLGLPFPPDVIRFCFDSALMRDACA
jgi:hypothetical protein